jgi:S-adenosylmethionine:diacylglycerol 3-amino-3-carboxypropyl transferase
MFGWTHEDSAIECAAFARRERAFCIAGGGCTALRLSSMGHRVTAVDINPAQVEYMRERSSGFPMREGRIERLMRRGRSGFPAIGWTRDRVREFLNFNDCAAQMEHWKRALDNRRWRFALSTLLSPWLLRLLYAEPLLRALPPNFGAILRRRLERGFAAHANRDNPYAWRMLTGDAAFEADPGSHAMRLVCADAAEFLESSREGSFDAFALSNIGDGAGPQYVARLRKAIARAAAPGAMVVARSFREPVSRRRNRSVEDRSLIWGTVDVRPVSEY